MALLADFPGCSPSFGTITLKTIAPEAYRFGLERGCFVSSESAEFDKKLYAQLKYVNDKANGRGPKERQRAGASSRP